MYDIADCFKDPICKNREYLINLLDLVKKPIIITFHTILKEPSLKQKEVLYELAKRSDRVVVMAEIAIEMLDEIYNVPKEKIVMIPHGVPDLPFDSQVKSKEIIGLKDKLIISTLGLLGPGKGLEYIITAIPKVIAKYPEARYLILGPTHPLVAKNTGESYRESLVSEIEKLGLSDYVIQYKKFFNNEDIALFLGATDIYITPYENPQQITSGTLARAVSMGRSCISTSYIYAKEVLGDERGLLIPFRDSDAISEAIITLISNESMRKEMENKSYQYSRPMTWENVANRYLKLSQEITS
ncbi:MAG: glycosyltransferase [Candidatus Berkelbacteria bacterium]|nr:glycosyltransferase [Candidatus Berkelbacteria bacterium]